MSAYIGYLIRRERLAQNLSQEGLCKGICAASYLSKIESGHAEPGGEIIDRLFAALGIEFVRDAQLMESAQRQLEQFLFLMDAGEPYEEQKAFFGAEGDRLARSEFALKLKLYELIAGAKIDNREETLARFAELEPFMDSLTLREQQWALIVKAEYQQAQQDEWTVLEQAARLGAYSLVTYKQAALAFQCGWYSRCMELAERAYAQAAEEGSAATMIWSAFVMGTCACNRYDMALAKRYYDRVLALTRGYRQDLSCYISYNLGSTYLEMGDDQNALSYLKGTQEREGDHLHNVLLHQKLAILFGRNKEREKGKDELKRAKECFAGAQWPQAWPAKGIVAQMLRFAELALGEAPFDEPEFEQVTRALYDGVTAQFSFGFKRFYGGYLVELFKRQRRYKEALLVHEEMGLK